MNKLSKEEYLEIICNSIINEYGSTIIEYDTDLKIAENVLENLKEYLFFRKSLKEDKVNFQKYRVDLKNG